MSTFHKLSGRSLKIASNALYGEVEDADLSNENSFATFDELDYELTAESDLSNVNHRIWITTTAALPWMTGTAVNPLLRALALTRGREEGFVTLLIPWLVSKKARTKLYGKEKTFADSDEQEDYIRNFCREKARCVEEEKSLHIKFYPAVYNEGFGSIFPTCDICGLIPDNEADIAILEEPEHLNWFRVPEEKHQLSLKTEGEEKESMTPLSQSQINLDEENAYQLGWTNKFRHVVGILHTNYGAYMQDYGLGTSIIGAPAITMLSSIVVRAYCHRVIRLSATLPSLAPNKEVTCNVHGVRAEFLEKDPEIYDADGCAPVYFIGKVIWAKGFDKVLRLQKLYKQSTKKYFSIDIYGVGNDERSIKRAFYGRKGMLRKDEAERKIIESVNSETTNLTQNDFDAEELFNRELSIRRQLSMTSQYAVEAQSLEVVRTDSGSSITISQASPTKNEQAESKKEEKVQGGSKFSFIGNTSRMSVSTCLAATQTVRRLSSKIIRAGINLTVEDKKEGNGRECSPFAIIGDLSGLSVSTGLAATQAVHKLGDSIIRAGLDMTFTEIDENTKSEDEDTEETGSLSENINEVLKNSKNQLTAKEKKDDYDKKKKRPFVFDPPQSIFELRRSPIPARFLGVKDHALLRHIPQHKIFLNMSTTEVLCTTTAEALAMGKFVIIPKHPSNIYFLQFPNCLAYMNIKDCMEKLKWALENDPYPLTEDVWHKFTWEGANNRLIQAAGITNQEERDRINSGQDKADREIAWIHVETAKKGQLVRNFLPHQK